MKNPDAIKIENETQPQQTTNKVIDAKPEKKEIPESKSELIEKIGSVRQDLETIEKELAIFEADKDNLSMEKIEAFNVKLQELIERAQKLKDYFGKENFNGDEGKIYDEFFYEEISRDIAEARPIVSSDSIRHWVGMFKLAIDRRMPELKNFTERDKEDEAVAKEAEGKLQEKKKVLLDKISEIRKYLSGGIFKGARKGKFEDGILDKLTAIEDYLEGNSPVVNIKIENFELKQLLDDYEQLRPYTERTKERIEYNKNRQARQSREIYDDIAKDLGEVKKYVTILKRLADILETKKDSDIRWQAMFEGKALPELGITEEDEQGYKNSVRESGETLSALDVKSFKNIRDSLKYFFRHLCREGGMSPEQALEEIKTEFEKIERTKFIAIGRKERGIRGLLTEGRLRCIWDFPKEEQAKQARDVMNIGGELYVNDRKRIEQKLGVWGKNPVSGLFGSENSRDELGAPPQYGDYLVVLKDRVVDRSVFIESDSMNPNWMIEPLKFKGRAEKTVVDRRLMPRHAPISKAIFNAFRHRPSTDSYYFPKTQEANLEYIEALICGGVKLEDVKEIVVKNPNEVPEDIRKLLEEKGIPLVKKVTFEKAEMPQEG